MRNRKKELKPDINPRQIELFEKYHKVDRVNKIITITLHFDKATDLLMTSLGNENHYRFNTEVLENINEIIETIPIGYKVEISFDIDDYESFDAKNIIESFNDTLEMNQYASRKKRQRKDLIASNLILIGITLLFIMVLSKANSWFGAGIKTDITAEVINIAAWVFVWEAVTMLFLEHSDQNIFALKIKTKVAKLSFYRNNSLLASEDAKDVFGNWLNESRVKRTGKIFTLISSFAFIFLAFYQIYACYYSLSQNNLKTEDLVLEIISSILALVLYLLAGLAGISLYKGNKKHIRFVGIYSILLLIGLVVTLLNSIINTNMNLIFTSLSSIVVNIFYISGYFIEKYIK